jgi:ribosomal protein L29
MKAKQLKEMVEKERNKKMKELKLELVKAKAAASKGGNSKIKQIKKIIARIHTVNNSEKGVLKNK